MADSDPLAARLDAIREDLAQLPFGIRRPNLDRRILEDYAPRLLAAVDAILKPHQPGRVVILGSLCGAHRHYPTRLLDDTLADHVRECEHCTAAVYVSCDGCGAQVPAESCLMRRRIAAELIVPEAGK